MRQSLALREQMRDAIQAEIAQRTQTHQARVAGLKAARANLLAIGAAAPPKPLALLAHGDSWFDANRFTKALGMVEVAYLDLFSLRDTHARGVPIYGHCYDYPVPNGTHPACAGPWLQPSLSYRGWNVAQGTEIVKSALDAFKAMLLRLANDPANRFTLIDTQGILQPLDWANELHPYPNGFKMLAGKFIDALKLDFPGRI